ncbi:hypothetical protein MASR2M47_31940 [Draconibacterium sp.]|jgi:hypothetical protein
MKLLPYNDLWECYHCSKEFCFEQYPFGYLGNYHPLCKKCSDELIKNKNSKHYNRMTFHHKLGNIEKIGSLLFPTLNQN